MRPRFVLQNVAGFFLHVDGKNWAVRHPIAARWFESREAADVVLRREFSRFFSTVSIRQLMDDCTRVRL